MSYFIVFLITIFLTFLANNIKRNNIASFALIILAMVIPSIFAGAKDLSIGVDTNVYAEKTFKDAVVSKHFISYWKSENLDLIYCLLNFLISRFTDNIFWFFFIAQLLLISSIYYTAYKFKNKFPIWISITMYLFIFYCQSLNIARQSLALVFSLMTIRFIFANKKTLTFFSLIISYFAHPTSAISFIYLLMDYVVAIGNKFLRTLIIVSLFALAIFAMWKFQLILNTVVSQGGDSTDRYSYYTDTSNGGLAVSTMDVAIRLFGTLVIYFSWRKRIVDSKIILYFFLINGVDFLLCLLTAISPNAYRLSFYFNISSYFYIPFLIYSSGFSKKMISLLTVTLLFVTLSYWYSIYVVHKLGGHVYPYSSKILDI